MYIDISLATVFSLSQVLNFF